MHAAELRKIVNLLKNGDVIAYPTEGVFGLGCDPCNEAAVRALLQLKERPLAKGLIIIGADWEQLTPWIGKLPTGCLQTIKTATIELTTWVVPASKQVPHWIHGKHSTVALRVTQHPIAKAICEAFGAPLVSTSANVAAQAPCLSYEETKEIFGKHVKLIVNQPTWGLNKSSKICDAISGRVLRA